MKAPSALESAIEKATTIFALLIVAMTWIFPHATLASSQQTTGNTALVFEIKPEQKEEALRPKQTLVTMEQIQNADPDFHMSNLLKQYLESKKSPMAACSDVLVHLKNYPKIISLSAAESGFARVQTPGSFNAWGVMTTGGKLKKMGNNWCESVANMDIFLSTYPRKSSVKYSDMSITDMCGLYKQPCPGKASHHWARNNNKILNDMANLQSQAKNQALAYVNQITTASNEVALAK
jgi:hypothetical protein